MPVYAGLTPAEARRALKRKEEPSYQGTFTSARRHVLHTFAHTHSALMKKRVAQFMLSTDCPACRGKRLRREALAVTFAGLDIAEMSRLPLTRLAARAARRYAEGRNAGLAKLERQPSRAGAGRRGGSPRTLEARLAILLDLGLGYLTLERSTPTLSPGELQRLRLATQVRSNLFGVVYVLDEPSAGLHPADTEALLARARSAEGRRQLALRRRARTRRDAPRRLDRRRRTGRGRARRRSALQRRCRADWPTWTRRGRGVISSPRRRRRRGRRARRAAGCGWQA